MINFSGTENLDNLIELEKVYLMSTLDIQKNFNKQILIFVKKFMSNINFSFDSDPSDRASLYLNESTSALNKSNSNISVLKDLLNSLSDINSFDENLVDKIKNYNNNFKKCMNSVYANTEIIEKFVHKITITDFCELPTSVDIVDTNTVTETVVENASSTPLPEKEQTSKYFENTLVISDTQKKVILPYKLNKIEEILQKNNKYNTIEDVINKFYTKPFSYYKFSPIARFKEAYKLVTEREKGSKFKALGLAFELFGNYSLHPAIITACKSLDELDIYLACLEENDLNDFHFFDIKYDIPLAISKLAKNNI